MKISILLSTFLLFLGQIDMLAAKNKPEPTNKTLIKAETHTLENGLKIIVLPCGVAPIVSVGILYNVGTADDPVDQVGLSHFIEHMMFKGTKKVPGEEFKKKILRNGGETNALTEYDYTLFYTTIAADKLELILELEADRLRNLSFTREEVDSEKNVVLAERDMRLGNNPFGSVYELYLKAMNPYHPYGVTPIGYPHHIKKYSFESVREHYNIWYYPNNATLIITGKTSLKEVLPLVEKLYGNIQSKEIPQRIRPQNPDRSGATQTIVQHNKRNAMTILELSYDAPHFNSEIGKKHYHALHILEQILGGNSATDFSNSIVNVKKLALSIQSSYDGDSIDPKDFSIVATLAPDITTADLKKEILAFIEKIIKDGISEDSLKRAKNDILASLAKLKDGTDSYLFAVANSIAKGQTIEDLNNFEKGIEDVTSDDVKNAALLVLGKAPAVVLEIYPDDKDKTLS